MTTRLSLNKSDDVSVWLEGAAIYMMLLESYKYSSMGLGSVIPESRENFRIIGGLVDAELAEKTGHHRIWNW